MSFSQKQPSGVVVSSETISAVYPKGVMTKITALLRSIRRPKAGCCVYQRQPNGGIVIWSRSLEQAYLPPGVADYFEDQWLATRSCKEKNQLVDRFIAYRKHINDRS
jgi:hypothetical protein